MPQKTLICPYCDREQYTHEPDVIETLMSCTECERCGKLFWYSFSPMLGYESEQNEEN